MTGDLISVGRVIKAHGIKGELCIEYNAESFDLLVDFIYLQSANNPSQSTPHKYTICGLRLHHERPLLLLEGVVDRSAAELLRNCAVLVPANRLPQPLPGEIYLKDLPGFKIFVQGDKENLPLGSISQVQDVAGQEIWVISTPDGQEVLFPAVPEFIVTLSPEKRVALITPPPGLLELYLGQNTQK
ncbi:MAG: ribosome maturation factor RimM [Deltaproteobacteria bacterium]|nr:ribosome maturation factor RimM [Deltaproteobacteria bacterium]